MRISDWSSDVCSSDLGFDQNGAVKQLGVQIGWNETSANSLNRMRPRLATADDRRQCWFDCIDLQRRPGLLQYLGAGRDMTASADACDQHVYRIFGKVFQDFRSEEHTSELQSLMRISYAVFCLKKKNKIKYIHITTN